MKSPISDEHVEHRLLATQLFRVTQLFCERLTVIALVAIAWSALVTWPTPSYAEGSATDQSIGVGPQYNTAHVYVSSDELSRFVASVVDTFGGKSSTPSVSTVTPTPSQATLQAALTPIGLISAFGFKTPIPFPFGAERTGYLVSNFDAAVSTARADGAAIVVAPFDDPIGRDVIIEWPGGVFMQLYRHTTEAQSAPLATVPENRIYVSPDDADVFVRDFVKFSAGKVVSDTSKAPGVEVGKPNDTYRRIRIESVFGKMAVFVTDGHLAYPFGRETTGYEVANISDTLTKAKTSGVTVLVPPYTADGRTAAILEFPGGYIAEIHSVSKPGSAMP